MQTEFFSFGKATSLEGKLNSNLQYFAKKFTFSYIPCMIEKLGKYIY